MLTKSIIIVFVAVLFLAGVTHASSFGFKIEDYIPQKFEDFQWQVGGKLNLNSSQYDIANNTDFYSQYTRSSESDRTFFNFSPSTSLWYKYETNDKFVELSSKLRLYLNYNHSQSESYSNGNYFLSFEKNSSHSHYSSLRFSISPDIKYGKYISDNYFISIDLKNEIHLMTDLDHENRENRSSRQVRDTSSYYRERDSYSESDNNRKSYRLNWELLTGKGHVYEGQYSSTALYLIKELKKNGLLETKPNSKVIEELAELIYNKRNERAIDKRIQRIEMFDELLTFLTSHGLINTDNHMAYLVVSDIWDFFPKIRRQFGSKFQVGCGFYYSNSNRKYESNSNISSRIAYAPLSDPYNYYSDVTETEIIYTRRNNTNVNKQFYLTMKYLYFKPITRKWQIDVESDIDYITHQSQLREYERYTIENGVAYDHDESEKKESNDRIILDVLPKFTYIHSSRSLFSFLSGFYFDFEDHKYSSDKVKWDYFFISSAKYRISIPTSLSIQLTYDSNQMYDRYRRNGNYDYDNIYDYHKNISLSVNLTHNLY